MTRLILCALVIFPQFVHAHARLLPSGSIPPRNSNAGLKTGPCGNVARTGTNTQLTAGSTVNVQWEEVIDHPGRYEFYFSAANDANFTLLKTVNDDQDGVIPSGQSHQYSTTLTLPSQTCTACTLQMIQVMTENPANPSLYYSCADIQLISGTPTATPTPSATPTPTPGPIECH